MIETTYSISEAEFLDAQKLWCSREFKKLPGRVLVFVLSIVFGVFVGLSFQNLPNGLAASLAGSLLAVVQQEPLRTLLKTSLGIRL